MTTPSRFPRSLRIAVTIAGLVLVASACSPNGSEATDPGPDDSGPATDETTAIDDVALTTGEGSATTDTETLIGDAPTIVFEPADSRGDAPFAPEAEVARCEPDELTSFLDTDPTIATAWADAADVSTTEIADTIGSYEATVLAVDTRVTNHAYRGGVARGFQATLEAGTAVLVDDAGVPRVRCACGNPLAPPRPVVEEIPDAPVSTTTVPAAPADDFCTTWQAVGPDMIGGPSGAGPDALGEYLDGLVVGFDQLIAVARTEPGFPAAALDDLVEYRNAIAVAALTPENPGAALGNTELRDRVEEFLTDYCGEPGDKAGDDGPTHVEAGDGDDDGAGDGGGTIEGGDGEGDPISNCGTMHFILLVAIAESLGVDHAATSQPYVDAIQAVTNGVDPGPEFDVSDLSVLIAREEIGCQGSQAMQQLLVDNGFGDALEDSSLGG